MTESEHLEQISKKVSLLYDRLYGGNGHVGDMTEMKELLKLHSETLQKHEGKLQVNNERWKALRWLGIAGLGGGISGLGALVKTLLN